MNFDTKTRNIFSHDKNQRELTIHAEFIQSRYKSRIDNMRVLKEINARGIRTGKLKFKANTIR